MAERASAGWFGVCANEKPCLGRAHDRMHGPAYHAVRRQRAFYPRIEVPGSSRFGWILRPGFCMLGPFFLRVLMGAAASLRWRILFADFPAFHLADLVPWNGHCRSSQSSGIRGIHTHEDQGLRMTCHLLWN